jgi:hydrogenase small subunit
MPGFPDKFMPFMDEAPGGRLSSGVAETYGVLIKSMRRLNREAMDAEPKWRRRGSQLATGYRPPAFAPRD